MTDMSARQSDLNRCLHSKSIAEIRLRIAERVHRILDHELTIRLTRTKIIDQLPLLRRVEKNIDRLLQDPQNG
jgi:hypothetical protein